jgi:CheY-like chemotaxis protein
MSGQPAGVAAGGDGSAVPGSDNRRSIQKPVIGTIRRSADVDATGRGQAVARVGAKNMTAQGQRVLVVEDDGILAEIVVELLGELGYEAVGPLRAIQGALEVLEREPPDAAILDVNLSGQSVYPLAESCADRGIPIVFMTGYADLAHMPARFHGCARIGKPFHRDSLAESLRRAIDAAA